MYWALQDITPALAIAFKFEAPEAVTTIKKIKVQVGRTGRITPVARVQAVYLSVSSTWPMPGPCTAYGHSRHR